MTASTPVERIGQLLSEAGYRQLPTPLQIAGLAFDIPAAYVGTNPSPDLILVADTAFDADQRILRKVEGIARALDVVKSKRPLTTILAGPRPRSDVMDSLVKVCRVLPVGVAVGGNESSLQNWLAVLMPLHIPQPSQGIANPLGEISAHLQDLDVSVAALVDLAPIGADAVQSRLHEILNEALSQSEGHDAA